jgi:hypothetical protein
MTSIERMYALYQSVNYILDNRLPGDFVECGVWRGGSAMMMAYLLKHHGIRDRRIYLYDTFEGMSAPTNKDKTFSGQSARDMMEQSQDEKETSVWCLADLEDVKRNLALTELGNDQLIYVKGKVEETVPSTLPQNKISLLRLDTDWYESTLHELNYFYPLLLVGGVMIVDDYGHWEGCRQAVDEYFGKQEHRPLLQRIDYTGRLILKMA